MCTRLTCLIMNKELCNIVFVFKTIPDVDSGYVKVYRERDRRIIRGEEVRGTMLRDY